MNVELFRVAEVLEGHRALVFAYQRAILISGHTKSETQEQIRTTVSEIVSDIANKILKARGN